jgi:hypothetical protein
MAIFWTGASGVGSGPHLDARIWDPRRKAYLDLSNKENRGYLNLLRAGEKGEKQVLGNFPLTSDYGPRNTGIPGASTFHKGVDFGTPEGTPITVQGGQWKEYRYDKGGGGHMGIFGFKGRNGEDLEMVLLHGQDRNAKTPRGVMAPAAPAPLAAAGETLASQLPAVQQEVVEAPPPPDPQQVAANRMREWAAANPELAKAAVDRYGTDQPWLSSAQPMEASGAGSGVTVAALPLRDPGVLDDALEARRRGLTGAW